jgi:hypothetical protein
MLVFTGYSGFTQSKDIARMELPLSLARSLDIRAILSYFPHQALAARKDLASLLPDTIPPAELPPSTLDEQAPTTSKTARVA